MRTGIVSPRHANTLQYAVQCGRSDAPAAEDDCVVPPCTPCPPFPPARKGIKPDHGAAGSERRRRHSGDGRMAYIQLQPHLSWLWRFGNTHTSMLRDSEWLRLAQRPAHPPNWRRCPEPSDGCYVVWRHGGDKGQRLPVTNSDPLRATVLSGTRSNRRGVNNKTALSGYHPAPYPRISCEIPSAAFSVLSVFQVTTRAVSAVASPAAAFLVGNWPVLFMPRDVCKCLAAWGSTCIFPPVE